MKNCFRACERAGALARIYRSFPNFIHSSSLWDKEFGKDK